MPKVKQLGGVQTRKKQITDAELSSSKLNSPLSLVIRFILRQWFSPLAYLLHFNMGVEPACLGSSSICPEKELKGQLE